MNQKQKDIILGVIKTNCTVQNLYSSSDGKCIIGGMAEAGGISLPHLNGCPIYRDEVKSFREALERFCGLGKIELTHLQEHNDHTFDLDRRRKRLTAIVESFPVEV